MGKWAADHHELVLRAKMKCLVTGAIERHKLDRPETGERMEAQISFRSFVEDLDTGDSFTTTLVDVLVRELADRRTRVVDEKRAISESTVKNLRSLAQHTRVPRENPIRRFQRRPSASHLNAEFMIDGPDGLLMDEDSDEVDTIVDSGVGSGEGVHLGGSELYEAYRSAPWPVLPHPPRSFVPSYPPGDEDVPSAPLSPASPPSTSRTMPWSMPPVPQPYGLSRQSTIRRAPSSYHPLNRYHDFSEFSHSRRSSHRQSHTPDPRESGDPERSDSFHPVSVRPHRTWTSWFTDPPVTSWASRSGHPSISLSDPVVPWTSADHLPFPTPSSTSSSQGDEDEPVTSRLRHRRLRRGGLRAPESMTFRETSATPAAASTSTGPAPTPVMPPSPISTPVSPPASAPIHENEGAEVAG